MLSLATEIFITVWNLASALASAIVELGMQFLSTVWNTFVAQVTAAIDAIVDAFNALVQWAIQMIQIHNDYWKKRRPRYRGNRFVKLASCNAEIIEFQ